MQLPAGSLAAVSGGLAAIVSLHDPALSQDDVPEQRLIRAALAHNDILMAYAAKVAIVPVRYGAIFSTEALLISHVAAGAADYGKTLARLNGMLEYAVALTVAEPVRKVAEMPAPTSGRSFLQARRAARVGRETLSQDRRSFAAGLVDAMAPWISAHRFAARPRAGRVLDASVLVARGDGDGFAARAAEVTDTASHLGLTLSVTGPLPPYSFTDAVSGQEPDNVA